MAAAGQSAARESAAATQAAAALRRRATQADRRAVAFKDGGEGERLVADAIAPLTAAGCYLLHDRASASIGGNIDHLLIGPPGVVVLNAKHWSAPAKVTGGKLFAGRCDQSRVLERATAETTAVRAALDAANLGAVPVHGVLVFTDTPPASGSDH